MYNEAPAVEVSKILALDPVSIQGPETLSQIPPRHLEVGLSMPTPSTFTPSNFIASNLYKQTSPPLGSFRCLFLISSPPGRTVCDGPCICMRALTSSKLHKGTLALHSLHSLVLCDI